MYGFKSGHTPNASPSKMCSSCFFFVSSVFRKRPRGTVLVRLAGLYSFLWKCALRICRKTWWSILSVAYQTFSFPLWNYLSTSGSYRRVSVAPVEMKGSLPWLGKKLDLANVSTVDVLKFLLSLPWAGLEQLVEMLASFLPSEVVNLSSFSGSSS